MHNTNTELNGMPAQARLMCRAVLQPNIEYRALVASSDFSIHTVKRWIIQPIRYPPSAAHCILVTLPSQPFYIVSSTTQNIYQTIWL